MTRAENQLPADQRADLMERLARSCGWLSLAHLRASVLMVRARLEAASHLAEGGKSCGA